jgi:hypothetical protein
MSFNSIYYYKIFFFLVYIYIMFWWNWPYLCVVCAEECDDKVCGNCKTIQKYICIHGAEAIKNDLDILYQKDGDKPSIRIHTRSIARSKL